MERRNVSIARSKLHFSPNLLNSINNAIEENQVCAIEYDSREKGISIRDVEPMAVIYKGGKRNMIAWCRLRDDYRLFRLDRINMIKLLGETFNPRADFNIDDFEAEEDLSRKDFDDRNEDYDEYDDYSDDDDDDEN